MNAPRSAGLSQEPPSSRAGAVCAICLARGILLLAILMLPSCRTLVSQPDPVLCRIDQLHLATVEGPEGFRAAAVLQGYLSHRSSTLLPPKHWREGYRLHIEQREQPPRGAKAADGLVPFERTIPIDLSGLGEGIYIVNVNGSEAKLELPRLSQAQPPP